MKLIAPLLSGIIIGLVLIGIAFSTANSVILITDKNKSWSSPTEFLPKIQIPEQVANRIVSTVEAKINVQ